jgi:hypothetical protein
VGLDGNGIAFKKIAHFEPSSSRPNAIARPVARRYGYPATFVR